MRNPGPCLLCACFAALACVGTVQSDAELPGATGEPRGAGPTDPSVPAATAPGTTPGAAPAKLSCDPSAATPDPGMRKLTGTEYRKTLSDLLAFALKDAKAAAGVLATLQDALGGIADRRPVVAEDQHGTFRRLDQSVDQGDVEATYDLAARVGAALVTGGRLGTVVGACATDASTANDDACITGFIQSFGERAFRRPLGSDEVSWLRGVYGTGAAIDADAFADLIATILTAPRFLYHVEHGAAPVPGRSDLASLSPFELAARLSYQLWETMPDDELWSAARSGALVQPAVYQAQVARLLADPRARDTMDAFFGEWLKLEDLPPLDQRNKDALFKTFAGADLPGTGLRQAMIDDALGLWRHLTWDSAGRFDDLLTSDLAFARTADLARIYGLGAWDGKAPPPRFAAGTRPGLLTRAALLATGSASTRPIMRGAFVRRTILCDELPPPPGSAAASPTDLDPKLTGRQVVEALTEMPGTTCAACHGSLLNPIGFAFEGFDGLGRARTDERLFSKTNGQEIGRAPIDTRSVPRIAADDARPSSGAADLVRLVVDSGKAGACFARSYFRFTYGRWEDLAGDGCAIERLRGSVASGAPLREVLRSAVLAPEFQQRSFR
jgi:hypothetical protein